MEHRLRAGEPSVGTTSSVRFFDEQFERQIREGAFELNPFERMVLPHLRGTLLDFGCGLGNLAIAAARRGCSVVALDASRAAIEHLRHIAVTESLSIQAMEADLRDYEVEETFDAVVSIGLLMFFDRPTALRQLARLEAHVRPGGIVAVNILVEGTTYLDMFDPASHCLLARGELQRHFAGWEVLRCEDQEFEAPGGTLKSFVTLIARRPPDRSVDAAQHATY